MRFSQSSFRVTILIAMILVAITVLLPNTDVYATDCNTNCDRSCTVETPLGDYVDPLCRQRCLLEKKIDCSTGVQSCDLWHADPNFYLTVAAIETANQSGLIETEHACHQLVDGGALAHSAHSGLSIIYEYAIATAESSSKFNPWAWAIKEAVKHQLHCACSAADYLPEQSVIGLSFRNKTNKPVWVAVGYYDNGWVSEGWWKIELGQTRTPLGGKLTQRYYYYYAEDSADGVWKGDYTFWTHPTKAFGPISDSLSQSQAKSQGYKREGFRQIDTGDHTGYTLNLID